MATRPSQAERCCWSACCRACGGRSLISCPCLWFCALRDIPGTGLVMHAALFWSGDSARNSYRVSRVSISRIDLPCSTAMFTLERAALEIVATGMEAVLLCVAHSLSSQCFLLLASPHVTGKVCTYIAKSSAKTAVPYSGCACPPHPLHTHPQTHLYTSTSPPWLYAAANLEPASVGCVKASCARGTT